MNEFETLTREIGKKKRKLRMGNYDGLGTEKKFILLCALMDPHIDPQSLTEKYSRRRKRPDSKRNFDEVWLIWEQNKRYKSIRLE